MSTIYIARQRRIHGRNIRFQIIQTGQEIKQSCRIGLTKRRIAKQIKTTFRNGGYIPQAEEKVLHYSRKRLRLESPNLRWARLRYFSHIRCNTEPIYVSSVDFNMLPPDPFGPFDQRPPTRKKSYPPEPTQIYANQYLEPTGPPISEMDVLSQQLEGHHMRPVSALWSEISSSRLRENCFGQILLKDSWRQKVSVDFLSLLLADCHIAMEDD